MTPKSWTQEETIALLTIVHMSTKLDGPKTDQDLANILNQKVTQGHLKRNLNTDNPLNKQIVSQRVYNLMENGTIPIIGQMRAKRKENPNMRPEEVTAGLKRASTFYRRSRMYLLPPTFLPPRQENSVLAIAGPLSSRGPRGLGRGEGKSQRHHPYGGRHQLKPQSRPIIFQQQTKPTPTPAQAHVLLQKFNGSNMGGTKNSHGRHGQGMAGHHPPSSNPQAPPHRESQQQPSMLATAPAPLPILQLNGSNLNETSHTSPHPKQPRPHAQPPHISIRSPAPRAPLPRAQLSKRPHNIRTRTGAAIDRAAVHQVTAAHWRLHESRSPRGMADSGAGLRLGEGGGRTFGGESKGG
ncbi:hypothetical protein F5882DRAFT_381130 [Hyaloscypha sp. PMI_1271]|nr:hypothetical protein F5882DRAFT_381130 [Hyaloscypha sp. PMI_1271]